MREFGSDHYAKKISGGSLSDALQAAQVIKDGQLIY
jgi:hypothetical protein